ncbi:MAG TPA: dihydroorotase [Acidimicrobiia bacterium]|nr:dihydroorotase [Acidimicrobiia bacterium]
MIVISGAQVWRRSGLAEATVVIDGQRVVDVGDVTAPAGARVIEAAGAVLGPGLVDLHVHFRDPGQTWKEDISTGSLAAVAGGFTAVVAMPNSDPPTDNVKTATDILRRGAEVGLVDIQVAGALTRGREGLEMAEFDSMYEAGVRLFTDDGDSVADSGLLRRIMVYLSDLPGAVVAEHAEDVMLTRGGHVNDGMMAASLGLGGMPAVAEVTVVGRDLALAAETAARLHLQHLSCSGSVDLIRRAKESGVAVTCEVTPHHLALDESAVGGLDPNFKMYPPLRTAADRQALIAALEDGTVDAVATDHAPHSALEKDVPFEEAPKGVIGLETSASVTWQALRGDAGPFFERMSVAPARIAGLERHGQPVEPGSMANLVLFDPERSWVPRVFRSKSSNSPFLGTRLTGRVMATIHDGAVVYEAAPDG